MEYKLWQHARAEIKALMSWPCGGVIAGLAAKSICCSETETISQCASAAVAPLCVAPHGSASRVGDDERK